MTAILTAIAATAWLLASVVGAYAQGYADWGNAAPAEPKCSDVVSVGGDVLIIEKTGDQRAIVIYRNKVPAATTSGTYCLQADDIAVTVIIKTNAHGDDHEGATLFPQGGLMAIPADAMVMDGAEKEFLIVGPGM